ncbi:MAG: DnaA ATPase domain-containing protein [Tepidiformaceae bacterium]
MAATSTDPRALARHWQAVLGRLQLEVPSHSWETWLKDTHAIRWDGAALIVEARTAFNCDWLEQKLRPLLGRIVEEIFGAGTVVAFVPRGTVKPAAGEDEPGAHPDPSSTALGAPARRTGHPGVVIGNVNSAYTFERYLPAEGNMIALESCRALAVRGENHINPVVIFGAPGMGKTHLLHALASQAANDGRSVVCLSAEEFASRFISACRAGNEAVADFQATARSAGLLVIDDLQYLTPRHEGTAKELVFTMDAVTNAGGDVVVASEIPPHEMSLLDRLYSRLRSGITVRVSPFHMAERRAFIERLAREYRVSLPAWAIERIAGCEVPSVRVLQGAVHSAVGLQRLNQLDMRRLDAELTVLSVSATAPGALEDRELLDAIADHFGVKLDDLLGRGRSQQVATARAAATAALRARGRGVPAIARLLDGRDPSTVRELSARGQRLLDEDEPLRRRIAG